MSFRDMVASDVENVFLNLDEFGEMHDLDGTQCACVIANDATESRMADLHGGRRTPDGLYGDCLTVCTRAADLTSVPKMGTRFKVDGKLYVVDSCSEDAGMLTIVLGAYRMGGAYL
nr:hypothetical protein [Mitsuokella multacida]